MHSYTRVDSEMRLFLLKLANALSQSESSKVHSVPLICPTKIARKVIFGGGDEISNKMMYSESQSRLFLIYNDINIISMLKLKRDIESDKRRREGRSILLKALSGP